MGLGSRVAPPWVLQKFGPVHFCESPLWSVLRREYRLEECPDFVSDILGSLTKGTDLDIGGS